MKIKQEVTPTVRPRQRHASLTVGEGHKDGERERDRGRETLRSVLKTEHRDNEREMTRLTNTGNTVDNTQGKH